MTDRPYTILVVDDEEAARWGLARLLRQDGYPTDEAPDGRAALELLGTGTYDLVITDLRMPRLGGLELIRQLKDVYDGRIIVMTAYGSPETYFKALEFGALDFINKPVDYDALLAMVHTLAAGRD